MATKKKTTRKAPAKRAPKKVSVDWNDEDSVKAAMAIALDATGDYDNLEIEEDRGLSSFGEGTFYRVTLDNKEYQAAQDDDSAQKLAIAVVRQDLEESPENFEPNFIESHINLDRLKRDLMSDVENMKQEDLTEEASRRPEQFLRDYESDISDQILDKLRDPETGDWLEDVEVPSEAVEEAASAAAETALKNPMDYLRDIYGDEAAKKAIEIAGIDVAAAAEEAVSTDGAGHFLARYDGHMHDGPGGIVWWRSN